MQRDHDRLRTLFDRFEELGARRHRERSEIFEEIRTELETHRTLEEELLYPAAAAAGLGSGSADIEGHRIVTRLLAELVSIGVADRRFDVVFAVLRGNVEEHITEEERNLIPQLETGLSSAHRDALGRALSAKAGERRPPV